MRLLRVPASAIAAAEALSTSADICSGDRVSMEPGGDGGKEGVGALGLGREARLR